VTAAEYYFKVLHNLQGLHGLVMICFVSELHTSDFLCDLLPVHAVSLNCLVEFCMFLRGPPSLSGLALGFFPSSTLRKSLDKQDTLLRIME
jgi:hypothetical protein